MSREEREAERLKEILKREEERLRQEQIQLEKEKAARLEALDKKRQEDDEAAYLEEVARQIEEEAERHEKLRLHKEKEKAAREEEKYRQAEMDHLEAIHSENLAEGALRVLEIERQKEELAKLEVILHEEADRDGSVLSQRLQHKQQEKAARIETIKRQKE